MTGGEYAITTVATPAPKRNYRPKPPPKTETFPRLLAFPERQLDGELYVFAPAFIPEVQAVTEFERKSCYS